MLKTDRTFNAPAAQQAAATIQDFRLENQQSLENPDAFWDTEASRHHWFEPWTKVLEHNFPDHAWFVGGKTNITFSAEWLKVGDSAQDRTVRLENYTKAVKKIADQAYWLPMYDFNINYGLSQSLNFKPHPDEFARWWLASWK